MLGTLNKFFNYLDFVILRGIDVTCTKVILSMRNTVFVDMETHVYLWCCGPYFMDLKIYIPWLVSMISMQARLFLVHVIYYYFSIYMCLTFPRKKNWKVCVWSKCWKLSCVFVSQKKKNVENYHLHYKLDCHLERPF